MNDVIGMKFAKWEIPVENSFKKFDSVGHRYHSLLSAARFEFGTTMVLTLCSEHHQHKLDLRFQEKHLNLNGGICYSRFHRAQIISLFSLNNLISIK